MKLESAYRKLNKHRHRWLINVSLLTGRRVRVTAAFRDADQDIPEELKGSQVSEFRNDRKHTQWGVGLANAMTAMADKLDRVEHAIQKHNEAVKAAKEASR